MSEGISKEDLQRLITRAPFHQWLGLKVESVEESGILVRAAWREEFVVNPDGRYTHGGILAALIDLVGDYAIAAKLGRAFPTIDMRVDYHRTAMPGDLMARGSVLKLGRQFSIAEARVEDESGKLLASGRGVYLTGQPG